MKKSQKLILISLIFAMITAVITPFCMCEKTAFAMDFSDFDLFPKSNQNSEDDLQNGDISEIVKQQMESLNLSEFEKFFGESESMISQKSFEECVLSLMKGEFFKGGQTFFDGVANVFFSQMQSLIGVFVTILALTILVSVLSGFACDFLSEDMQSVVNFSLVLIVTAISAPVVLQVASEIKSAITSLSSQAEIAFPILLTLVFTLGGSASATCFSPLLYTLSNVIIKIVSGLVFPVFMFVLGVNIINAVSKNMNISGVSEFCISVSKYMLGVTFTVFSACMALGGISAGSYDSISYRTAKYAIASSVPVIGGYVRDGFDLILYSGVLVKNAVGVGFVLVGLLSAIAPLVKIVGVIWMFRLVEAVSSPFCTSQISTLYKSLAKSLSLVVIAYIAVLFMYSIAIIMLMISTNILF